MTGRPPTCGNLPGLRRERGHGEPWHAVRHRSQSDDPAAPRSPEGPRERPLVQLGPPDARAVRAPASRVVGRCRPQPQGLPQARRPAAPDRRRRGPAVPGQLQPASCRPTTRITTLRRRRNGGQRAERGRPRRLFLRRIRLPREPADLFRRPRHPRRRPLQGRERRATAARRRRAALPAGLLRADHRRRRQPATSTYADSDFADLPLELVARRAAATSSASPSICPAATCRSADLARACGPRHAVSARYRRPGKRRARPHHHVPALRRRSHDAHRAGNRAGHRRRARARRGRDSSPQFGT